jgi:hypothetical protein
MTRVSVSLFALIALVACGQTERDSVAPMTTGSGGEDTAGSSSTMADTAGAAGTGGAFPTESAVTECEQYCETPYNRLPQALCEDWNRTGWEPPFCDLDTTAPCPYYCGKVYETVTPTCAPLLSAVIRCVAPYYASGTLSTCWLANCRDELFTMTSACYGLREKLAAARATWQASGVVDYDLAYDLPQGEKAHVAVREGQEPMATPAGEIGWTVPLLFDAADRFLHESGGTADVQYDPNLGYVIALRYRWGCEGSFTQASGVEVAPLR